MKMLPYMAGLLALWMLLFALPVAGQVDEPTPPSSDNVEATTETEIPPSQEVEINEDNYRQFMELKDPNLQREIIPENTFKPGSGLQKLEKLPEESQKHLRNELREIIVQGDPWQPGDEQGEYPYTPSPAAANNPGLENQEREAWGELVDSYNQREAQIHANSAGSRAARGTEDGSGANPGDNRESAGDGGQDGEGSPAQQTGQQGKPSAPDTAGTYSPNTSNDPNANSTAGVSQNAMEFLQGMGKAGDGQAQSAPQSAAQTTSSDSVSPAHDTNTESTAGASQNAMEFLTGNAAQTGNTGEGKADSAATDSSQDVNQADEQESQNQDQGQEIAQKTAATIPPADTGPVSSTEPEEDSTAGDSQNALEYLTGERGQAPSSTDDESNPVQPEGILSIQDLLNAQGVGASPGAASTPGEAKQTEKTDPDKDGGNN